MLPRHIPYTHNIPSSDKACSQWTVHFDVCVLHVFAGSPNGTADEAWNTDTKTNWDLAGYLELSDREVSCSSWYHGYCMLIIITYCLFLAHIQRTLGYHKIRTLFFRAWFSYERKPFKPGVDGLPCSGYIKLSNTPSSADLTHLEVNQNPLQSQKQYRAFQARLLCHRKLMDIESSISSCICISYQSDS